MGTFSPAVGKEEDERDDTSHIKLHTVRGRGGERVVRGSTTLLDSAVVKLSFGVGGVAPGSVLVPVWITTVVLCQIGLRMRPRVYPGKSHRAIKGIQPSNKCFSPRVGGTSPPACCYLFLCTPMLTKHIMNAHWQHLPNGIRCSWISSNCGKYFFELFRKCLIVWSYIVHGLHHPVVKSL